MATMSVRARQPLISEKKGTGVQEIISPNHLRQGQSGTGKMGHRGHLAVSPHALILLLFSTRLLRATSKVIHFRFLQYGVKRGSTHAVTRCPQQSQIIVGNMEK